MILRPVNKAAGNHKVWYELTNRGSIVAFPQLNDASTGGNSPTKADDAGNGFLMRQGFSILISGWDTTAAPENGRFMMKAPVAVTLTGGDHWSIAGRIQHRRHQNPFGTPDLSGGNARQDEGNADDARAV